MRRGIVVLVAFVVVAAGPASLQAASESSPQLVKLLATSDVTVPPNLGSDVDGMVTDSVGNLYVGARGGAADGPSIAVFDASGNLVRSWASEGTALTIGPDGLIYVAPATYGGGIDVYNTDGTPVRTFASSVNLLDPVGIAVGPQGDIWVTSHGDSFLGFDDDAVVHLSPAGAVLGHVTPLPQRNAGGTNIITGMALDPDGSLWMTVNDAPELVHYDASGKQLAAPDPAVLMGHAEGLSGVAVANGHIYVTGGTDEVLSSIAAAVFTPEGQLLDVLPGTASIPAAGADGTLYLTRYVSSASPAQASKAGGAPITRYKGVPVFKPAPGDAYGGTYGDCQGTSSAQNGVVVVSVLNTPACRSSTNAVVFVNKKSPCNHRTETGRLVSIDDGGTELIAPSVHSGADADTTGGPYFYAYIPGDRLTGGDVLFKYSCTLDANPNATGRDVYEWKGEVTRIDPSGTVVGPNGHGIAGASVRLLFSPTTTGPFVAPGLTGIDPQVPVEQTGQTGTFSWDVAAGFWRLRVSAFGYRSLTSPAFHVPPAVTGIKLKLTSDPGQQARLIDPAGTVGRLHLGAHASADLHTAGLKLRIARGRIVQISVTGRRFRTALGISIGSTFAALAAAYPTQGLAALRAHSTSVRVTHASFTTTKGRVNAITLTG